MFRTIKAIKSKLSQSPYVSNCIYYGTLFCAAEVSQQVVIKKYLPWSQGEATESFDIKKLGHLAGWGYVMAPSYMTVWYGWLDTRFVATTSRIIAVKVVLDQTLLTIPLLLAFFPYMAWCQGDQDLTAELKEKLAVTYGVSCCWWLPAQAINFKLVPPKYRIIYNGACGFVWANILCAIKRSGEMK